jgi:hypothetical protein
MSTAGCTFCREILVGFMLTHEPVDCPLKMSAYCSFCLERGHYLSDCVKAAVAARPHVPNIKYKEKSMKPVKPVLEIEDKEVVIRSYLLSKSIPISQKKGENKERIKVYAEENGYNIIFVS